MGVKPGSSGWKCGMLPHLITRLPGSAVMLNQETYFLCKFLENWGQGFLPGPGVKQRSEKFRVIILQKAWKLKFKVTFLERIQLLRVFALGQRCLFSLKILHCSFFDVSMYFLSCIEKINLMPRAKTLYS